MRLKSTVRLGKLKPQIVLALYVAADVWAQHGEVLTITSANDSIHSGRPVVSELKDPHYTGRAVDIRIKDVDKSKRADIVMSLKTALTQEYLILWESQDGDNEHVHIQFQGEA